MTYKHVFEIQCYNDLNKWSMTDWYPSGQWFQWFTVSKVSNLKYPVWVEDIWLYPCQSPHWESKLNKIKSLLLRSFCLQNIFSRNCCLKIKNRNAAIILVQTRPDIIRQYDITNIVLIAIRPYNNTQIMDIIEKYDLFYIIYNKKLLIKYWS